MKPFPEPIYVTRPLLPPLDTLHKRLEQVWASQWLTNGWEQHNQLEAAIRGYLGVPQASLFNNGTIALLTAIRALDLTGEVITTPFTFPATPHAIVWSGLAPVFADIDPVRMTLDPARVEALVTPRTSAILGVHVYGIPCDVEGVSQIARRHGLKVVYDAAHAFGTRLREEGIGNAGDVSMFSFHSTKLFHTAEGGVLTCRDVGLKALVDHLKNFGIVNQDEVDVPGINGKMNELQAALGLAVLEHVPGEIARRNELAARYRARLDGVPGIALLPELAGVDRSPQYFVIRIDEKAFGWSRDQVFAELKHWNVFSRKYFFPLCSDYACYRDLPSAAPDRLPVAREVVRQVLCLPIYGTLPPDAVDRICEIITALHERSHAPIAGTRHHQ